MTAKHIMFHFLKFCFTKALVHEGLEVLCKNNIKNKTQTSPLTQAVALAITIQDRGQHLTQSPKP